MKVQKVAQLLKAKLLDRARNEMQILLSLHHPFLVRLHYCFVDNNQLCMLLDFCDGGDLFHFTRKLKSRKLHHMAAGFYIGEVTLAALLLPLCAKYWSVLSCDRLLLPYYG